MLAGWTLDDVGARLPWRALGALVRHTTTKTSDYQPMNANFGILDPLEKRVRGKKFRYEALSERALADLDRLVAEERLED